MGDGEGAVDGEEEDDVDVGDVDVVDNDVIDEYRIPIVDLVKVH